MSFVRAHYSFPRIAAVTARSGAQAVSLTANDNDAISLYPALSTRLFFNERKLPPCHDFVRVAAAPRSAECRSLILHQNNPI